MKEQEPRLEMPDMAFYRLRDSFAEGLNPANSFEVTLLNVLTQNYQRRNRLMDLEDYLYKTNPPEKLLGEAFEKLKAIQRMVAQADRAYRQALKDFYHAQKMRLGITKKMHFDPPITIRQYPPRDKTDAPKPNGEAPETAPGRASPKAS